MAAIRNTLSAASRSLAGAAARSGFPSCGEPGPSTLRSHSILARSRALHTTPPNNAPPGPRRPAGPGSSSGPSSYASFPPPNRPQSPRPGAHRRDTPAAPSNPLTLTDGQIPFRTVQLVSATTNALSPPTALADILTSYDPAVSVLTLVSSSPPIVKLLNREELRSKARLAEVRAKLQRKSAVEEKEVQVSWLSAAGDLAHKLDLARSILERGDRVTLIFANKAGRGAEQAAEEVKRGVREMFEEGVREVGARWKDDEVGRATTAQYWGPIRAVREERRAKVQEEEVRKREERDEKKEARKRKEEERRERAARRAKEGQAPA